MLSTLGVGGDEAGVSPGMTWGIPERLLGQHRRAVARASRRGHSEIVHHGRGFGRKGKGVGGPTKSGNGRDFED